MEKADCYGEVDRLVIRANIYSRFGSLAALTTVLKALVGKLLAQALVTEGGQGDAKK